jgi:AraC-like DNA-binding protein
LEETDTGTPLARVSSTRQDRLMHGGAADRIHMAPSAPTASAISALFVDEHDRDLQGVALPRPEIHLVVRFGPATRNGLDVHALGVRERVYRKLLPSGQRAVTARLRLGAPKAVLGVPASAIAGRIVALEDLWGHAATERLVDRLAGARDTLGAAKILERAIAERVEFAAARGESERLALDAANRLTSANVGAVALDLGVSERHLRRVFRETVGVSPKAFARLVRFRHALRAARSDGRASWASIATLAGYYDQAHLIAEFRAIAGMTPRAFLGELRAAKAVG